MLSMLAAVAALTMAACGGDDDDRSSPVRAGGDLTGGFHVAEEKGRGLASHILLSFVPSSKPSPPGTAPTFEALDAPSVDFGELPGVGDSFGSDLVYDDFAIEVEPGSELATWPVSNGGVTGGFDAVLHVDGDAEEVLTAYARQARELVGEDASDDGRFREGTREVHHLYFDSFGGYKVGLEMVDDGDDGWLLIDVGND